MRSPELLSIILALSSTALATCYFPNGNVSDTDTACDPDALVSACCFDGQACTSDGLCVSDPHDPVISRWHRGTCTDQAWRSGNCPRQCLDINNNGAPVYSCNSTSVDSYCCYDNCQCNDSYEVFSFSQSFADMYTVTIIGETFTQTHSSTTPSSSTTAQITSASTTASTSTSALTAPVSTGSAESGSKPTDTTALGAGLGVGLPGVAAVLVGAFFLWRRKKRAATPVNGTVASPSELDYEELYPRQAKDVHYTMAEGPSDIPIHELPAAQQTPVELPAIESPTLNGKTGLERRA